MKATSRVLQCIFCMISSNYQTVRWFLAISNLIVSLYLSWFATQGPYDVVLLPGGMPGAQNLAEVRNTQLNSMSKPQSLHGLICKGSTYRVFTWAT